MAARKVGGRLGALVAGVTAVLAVLATATPASADVAFVWTRARALATPRVGHDAVLLPDGRVLVTGGFDGDEVLDSTEIYNPVTNRWIAGPPMSVPRSGHTATALASGKVFVTGGGTAEIYTPWTRSWAPAASPALNRTGHTATLLPDGRVLVVGGVVNVPADVPEIYTPWTDSWTSTGELPYSSDGLCGGHTATLVGTKVVVAAGNGCWGGTNSGSAVFDTATGTWSPIVVMINARLSHGAAALRDGGVLVAGGDCITCPEPHRSAERWDLVTGAWSTVASMRDFRVGLTLTTLRSGVVLAAGGPTAEVYVPWLDRWLVTGPMRATQSNHTATMLRDGSVQRFRVLV